MACLAAVLLLLTGSVGPQRPGGFTAEAISRLWADYGDTGGRWNGGDGAVSVLLPDGRVAWLFSRTYLGPLDSGGRRTAAAPVVDNSLVVQVGQRLTETRFGGDIADPSALVRPAAADERYAVGSALTTADTLQVLYHRYRGQGADATLLGTSLATFALPALTLLRVRTLPVGSTVAWGAALLAGDGHSYIYGSRATGSTTFLTVARVAGSDLSGAWQFWTGSAWSTREAEAAAITSGVDTDFSVLRAGQTVSLVTRQGGVRGGGFVVARTAPDPTGPFGEPRYLFTAPEAAAPNSHAGAVHAHPELSRPDQMLLSYAVTSRDPAAIQLDAAVDRPRFVAVPWPPARHDAHGAVPRGLRARATGGSVQLAWQPPPGGALAYWVERRDVTAGQDSFVRLGQPVVGTTARDDQLAGEHRFEYRVAAVRSDGESAPSAAVAVVTGVTPHSGRPGVVTGLQAVMAGDHVALSWDPPLTGSTTDLTYSVRWRDLTKGEQALTEWSGSPTPRTAVTVAIPDPSHGYEFTVVPTNDAGDGPASTGVPVWPAPPPPLRPR